MRTEQSQRTDSLAFLKSQVAEFVEEREWDKFHNPKDLALSLIVEAAELLELTQWKSGNELTQHLKKNRQALEEELSDVLYWVLLISHHEDIDLSTAFEAKMNVNRKKYPVSLAKGNTLKYDVLAEKTKSGRKVPEEVVVSQDVLFDLR